MMLFIITKYDVMLMLFVIDFNIVILFDCLVLCWCCCCCLGHNVAIAVVLHFQFLLLLLLFATQPLQTKDTKHCTSLLCHYHCHDVIVSVVLHFQFNNFVPVAVWDKTATIRWYQKLHIPSLLSSPRPPLSTSSFFELNFFLCQQTPLTRWIPCVINYYCCYRYYYFALSLDPNESIATDLLVERMNPAATTIVAVMHVIFVINCKLIIICVVIALCVVAYVLMLWCCDVMLFKGYATSWVSHSILYLKQFTQKRAQKIHLVEMCWQMPGKFFLKKKLPTQKKNAHKTCASSKTFLVPYCTLYCTHYLRIYIQKRHFCLSQMKI